ncbi:hypothetical protein LZ017_07610 [Pelomonas sp. CA6]|uniref:hypothetical protein n=1 Tax=Pelomonas sp. CA6 TaxID=2907999 RepID=UPI001F4BDA6E|nr:hypothetical protein [Pelomonas sp. CA6]MCH7343244.1 hypothetical protein [Pelomonas sp. CA6]
MKRTFSLGLALAASLITATSFAQTATPRVDQREAQQQARIAQGAASGSLTAHETQRLEREQAAINKTEAQAKSDGTVTRKERRHLQHMQNHASADIKRLKHNERKASQP